MPGTHHPFGPSSLNRRMLCPGSYRMEDGLPETESEEANEGTRLHAVMAGADPGDWMDGEQQELIEWAGDKVRELDIIPGTERREERLVLMDGRKVLSFGSPDLYGMQSAYALAPPTPLVVDYKFGRGDVPEPAENIQMADYSAMVMRKLRESACLAVIIQPRLRRMDSYLYTDMPGIVATIRKIRAASEAEDAPLVPGEEQCKYCRAKLVCPALQAKCKALAERAPADVIPYAAPAQLAEMYDRWKLAERFGKALKTRIREVCEAEGECAGLYLKPKAGDRSITDPEGAFGLLSGALTADEFLACSAVSVSQLEAKYAAKYGERTESGRMKPGEGLRLKRQLADLLGDCVTAGKPSFVLTKKKES